MGEVEKVNWVSRFVQGIRHVSYMAESRRSAREWGQGNGAIVAWDASREGKNTHT